MSNDLAERIPDDWRPLAIENAELREQVELLEEEVILWRVDPPQHYRTAGDPSTNWFILLLHIVFIAGACAGFWWLWDIEYEHPYSPLTFAGFGFLFGVSLYSLYWRVNHGYWPD